MHLGLSDLTAFLPFKDAHAAAYLPPLAAPAEADRQFILGQPISVRDEGNRTFSTDLFFPMPVIFRIPLSILTLACLL